MSSNPKRTYRVRWFDGELGRARNPYVVIDGQVWIALDCRRPLCAVYRADHFPVVSTQKWRAHSAGDGGHYVRGQHGDLHRAILESGLQIAGYDVHHRDGCRFNNVDSNLELIEHGLHLEAYERSCPVPLEMPAELRAVWQAGRGGWKPRKRGNGRLLRARRQRLKELISQVLYCLWLQEFGQERHTGKRVWWSSRALTGEVERVLASRCLLSALCPVTPKLVAGCMQRQLGMKSTRRKVRTTATGKRYDESGWMLSAHVKPAQVYDESTAAQSLVDYYSQCCPITLACNREPAVGIAAAVEVQVEWTTSTAAAQAPPAYASS